MSLEDVTAEVQGAERLRRSERYARDLFEHSPVSLWVEDFSHIRQLLDEVRARAFATLPLSSRCIRSSSRAAFRRSASSTFKKSSQIQSENNLNLLTHSVFQTVRAAMNLGDRALIDKSLRDAGQMLFLLHFH